MESLFNYAEHIDPNELVNDERLSTLVITLGAFGDTGHVQRLLNSHALNQLTNYEVGKFDIDQLHDYTGRRPSVSFDYDHFKDYSTPEMVVHHITDVNGTPFLLLTGPEPSFRWERLASSIEELNEHLGIKQTVFLQSLPSPTPHTRPTYVNAFASRPELITDWSKLAVNVQMPATFTSMLSVRLTEAAQDVIGLVAHVPHYLADIEYPDATVQLLGALRSLTQLDIPNGELAKACEMTREMINSQVAESPELQQAIVALETRYDQGQKPGTLPGGKNLPTADEIGEEVEAFLRNIGSEGNDSA